MADTNALGREKNLEPYIQAFFRESGLIEALSNQRYVPDSHGSANHFVEDYLIENDPNRKLQFQYYPGTWFGAVFRPFFSIKYSTLLAQSQEEREALRTSGLVPMIINMGLKDDGMEKRPSNALASYTKDYGGIEVCC